eukprot:m.4751 g.4751  ORF g.4751 m.4751 type:complete len:538 (+) comp11219_c0_seq2:222-1835(+)
METDVPQCLPLSSSQVQGKSGGFVFKVTDMNRLRRFLCLGSENGTYYTSEKELGKENAESILRLIEDGKGKQVVREIVDFSVSGRAAKQNPILFALALCARSDDETVKKLAYGELSRVCRIPTHLFSFVEFCQKLSGGGTGWGRAHRRAIQFWYNGKGGGELAMAVTKYQQRGGWSHRDLARLSHLKPTSDAVRLVVKYFVKGMEAVEKEFGETVDGETLKAMQLLLAVEEVKKCEDHYRIASLIRESGLVREHIPSNMLNSTTVWAALLENMPMTAMIRNLGKMSSIGLLGPLSSHAALIRDRLADGHALKKARIHPFNVLLALNTYQKGRGEKGKLTWEVNQTIVSALDNAFYLSFKFVEPTGKRYLLALDVSGSMHSSFCLGSSSISAGLGAAAMAMATARSEKNHHMMAFSSKLVPLNIHARMRLDAVVETMNKIDFGGTDCAQPMLWAMKRNVPIDVFIVYTDSETWHGHVHPSVALQNYRKKLRIDSRLIVCGMTSNGFTIADPDDAGMLDMAGFDAAAPEVIRNFSLGNI